MSRTSVRVRLHVELQIERCMPCITICTSPMTLLDIVHVMHL
jgi:hypothetical protein